ncbi:MAG: alpha/beta hydrolase [Lautropia sp.]|nr:alpha/beta hydrolase [Lautropia sp.]
MAAPIQNEPQEAPAAAAPSVAIASGGSGATPHAYRPRVDDTSRYVTVRGLRYHLRVWETQARGTLSGEGPPGGEQAGREATPPPTLVMLHGWMDVSASFQFVVDALQGRWRVVAPDWRGFGLTEGSPGKERAVDSYAFADYLGDLDALLDGLCPDEPVRLVAHSMGGNVAMLYAGIRPQRVAGVVNLEGFGLPETDPAKAVGRYRRWLDELKEPSSLRPFSSLEEVAARLMKTNPRLPRDKAGFLAGHWARPVDAARHPGGGPWSLRADPAHKRINPVPYRVDEALSCWAAIEAPVLWVASRDRDSFHEFTRAATYRRRLAVIRRLREVEIADAGHMVHHDQPAVIGRLIEDFFSR